MNWADFSPYILPYVVGCPDPVLTHHIRLAAIDFFRRTCAWQETLEPDTTFGVEFDMMPDQCQQVIKIRSVSVDGRTWPLVSAQHGLELVRSQSPQDFAFTQDNRTIFIYPQCDVDRPVQVDVVLAPTLKATGLPDTVAYQHASDIAFGAIASIQRIPGQPFTDLNSSTIKQMEYNTRTATVAAKTSRGLMTGRMRARTSYL